MKLNLCEFLTIQCYKKVWWLNAGTVVFIPKIMFEMCHHFVWKPSEFDLKKQWAIKINNKNKWHTSAPTHGLPSTLRIRPSISPGQWQRLSMVAAGKRCFDLVGSHQDGIAVWYRTKSSSLFFTAEAGANHPFKPQHKKSWKGSSRDATQRVSAVLADWCICCHKTKYKPNTKK